MEQKEISVIEIIKLSIKFFKFLLKNWWVFLIIGFLFSSLGYFIAKSKHVQFEVNALIGLKGKEGGGAQSAALALASQLGFPISNSSVFPDNKMIVGICKSRRAIKTCLLKKVKINNTYTTLADASVSLFRIIDTTTSKYKFKANTLQELTYTEDSILNIIFDKLSVDVLKPSIDEEIDLVRLKATSGNLSFSIVLTQTMIEFLNDFFVETVDSDQKTNLTHAVNRADSIYRELKSKEIALAMLNDGNISVIKSQAKIKQVSLMREVAMLNKMFNESTANVEMLKYMKVNDKSIIIIVDDPNYSIKLIKTNVLYYIIGFAFLGCIITLLILGCIEYYKKIKPELNKN